LGHELHDLGLDVVHVRVLAIRDAMVLDRPLRELRKRPLHLLAHVGLALIAADPDAVALDVNAIGHGRQISLALPGL
jgi:hypothetical protein